MAVLVHGKEGGDALPKRGRGQPTKLTAVVQRKICEAIAAGNYPSTSARYAGVTPACFCNWKRKGEAQKRGVYREFLNAVRKAEADCEVRTVALWQKQIAAGQRDPAGFLARRFPKRSMNREGREQTCGSRKSRQPSGSTLRVSVNRASERENGRAGGGHRISPPLRDEPSGRSHRPRRHCSSWMDR